MYLELFKLHELPFRLSPDPQFLYLSKQHARAKAYMESTIWFTDGFVVITGEIGAGKTTLIESFLKEVPTDVVVAQINQTQVSPIDFLQAVLVQFGFSPFKMRKGELIATLNTFLIEQYAAGRKVLLIVDEAQNLSMRVLEEVRMLSGVETTKEKVLRIILAGQPELNEKLDAPELAQLTQRVRLRFHLQTLSEAETRGYIEHRLDVAAGQPRERVGERNLLGARAERLERDRAAAVIGADAQALEVGRRSDLLAGGQEVAETDLPDAEHSQALGREVAPQRLLQRAAVQHLGRDGRVREQVRQLDRVDRRHHRVQRRRGVELNRIRLSPLQLRVG